MIGPPPARVFRLTRLQLDNTAQSLLSRGPEPSAQELLPGDPLERNYEFASHLEFNQSNFTPFVSWLEGAAEGERDVSRLSESCADAQDANSCMNSAVSAFVRRAFRDVPEEEVIERFVSFYSESVAAVGAEQALVDLVGVVLSSPHFAFREEVLVDSAGYLPAPQALQNLSYTLADLPPEAISSLGDVAEGPLPPAELEARLPAVLSLPAVRDKLLRFFLAWLEVREPDEFDISTVVFPEFTPELATAMVEETRGFLEQALSEAAPRLSAISESKESFVDDALAELYGIDAGSGLVALPSDQRHGIFTHPSVIASHSGPDTTRLVKRGVFFTRKVMCQQLGAPPPGSVPEGEIPGETERERIEGITSDAPCSGCHSYINPFGFMQESYDPLGRWRQEDEAGFPIDPSITVDFLDEGPAAYSEPVEALTGFTQSLMFKQCFVRQLFTFYMGREPEDADDPLLREAFFHFARGEQDIIDVLSRFALAPQFNRREAL